MAQFPEAAKALTKARIKLMTSKQATFFCVVVLTLRHVWDETCGTAWTDGTTVGYCPKFFMDCTPDERVGLVLHEALHVVFFHMLRLGGRDPRMWNVAADYVINLIIIDAGFKLPKCGLLDDKYRGMSVEQVYDLIMQEKEKHESGSGMDDLIYGKGTPAEQQQIKDAIDSMLVHAVTQSKIAGDDPGSVPGAVARYVQELLNPKIPWQSLMRRHFNVFDHSDYSYRRLNRRMRPHSLVMPTMRAEALESGAVAIDASGSVTDDQFSYMIGELSVLIKRLKPPTVSVLQFTSQLRTPITVVKNLTDFKTMKFAPKGGTAIDPPLAWARDNKPAWFVIFTDGEFRPPTIKPKCPVIWLINDNPNFTAPFGKVIHYNSE